MNRFVYVAYVDSALKQTSKNNARFLDDHVYIGKFADRILVKCPRCAKCATLSRGNVVAPGASYEHRLTCVACAFVRDDDPKGWAPRDAKDPYYNEPLWLATPCCGHTLWAYNWAHLQYLE